MKYEATFNEIGIIFTTIAKAEEKVKALKEAEDQYNNASDAYYNGGDFEPMHDAFEARAKARKAVKAIFQKVIDVLELNPDNSTDEFIIREAGRLWEPMAFITSVKYHAVQIVKYVNI